MARGSSGLRGAVFRAPHPDAVSLLVHSDSHREGTYLQSLAQKQSSLFFPFLAPPLHPYHCAPLLSPPKFPPSIESSEEEKGRGEKFETAQDG